MRIAHNCFRCGLDLTGRRAPPDPHYQLAVVVCPRCTAACVRTKPEAIAIWREASHLFYAWTRLGFQLGLGGFLGWATYDGADAIKRGVFYDGLAMSVDGWFRFGGLVATVLASALWLGSCFPHWRRVPLVLVWMACLLVFPVAASIDVAHEAYAWRSRQSAFEDGFGVFQRCWEDFASALRVRPSTTSVLMLLGLAEGLLSPIGVVLVWLNHVMVRRKNRRRLRLMRQAKGSP